MSEPCALCDRESRLEIYPPAEWEQYLREERGMAPPIGGLVIPLCSDCYDEVSRQKATYRELGYYSDEQRQTIKNETHALLNRLDLDALVDRAM